MLLRGCSTVAAGGNGAHRRCVQRLGLRKRQSFEGFGSEIEFGAKDDWRRGNVADVFLCLRS